MEYSIHHDKVAVRTHFSETYDLTQFFHGVCLPENKPTDINRPVDFLGAGLVRRNVGDIWHIDRMLSFATDEATPLMIGGGDIGANHGYPCLVRAALTGDVTAAEPDTVWQDENGHLWRLVRREQSVEGAGDYLFLGEMQGMTLTTDAFRNDLAGTLTRNGKTIHATRRGSGIDFTSALHHTGCAVRFDKAKQMLTIEETYDILHPGFFAPKTAIKCETLFRVKNIYSIADDGEITVRFSYTSAADAPVTIACILGIMYQEKCDIGGGVLRTIPGSKSFSAIAEDGAERRFDFSKPMKLAGVFPKGTVELTEAYWANPDEPPQVQFEELLDTDGSTVCTFEAGFESRPYPVHSAWQIVPSRKTYPVFADNLTVQPGETVSGTAYRRYLPAKGKTT